MVKQSLEDRLAALELKVTEWEARRRKLIPAELEADERRYRLERTREPDLGFAWPVYRWARGESLSAVLVAAEANGAELSAGDFVRWCRQVVDVLDQVRGVEGENSAVGAAAAAAVRALRRGVVALGTV